MTIDRRRVLLSSLLLGSSAALTRGRYAFAAEQGYGPLGPVLDDDTGLPLLRLPEGFRYRSFGWTGEPMTDGTPTPDRHDGMAVVHALDRRGDSFVLIRNHERAFASRLGGAATPVYDRFAAPPRIEGCGGGTTALVFKENRFVETVPTLAGTLVNCAGGATPWGSWLTCEEIVVDGREDGAHAHGYVFEVPAPHLGVASAKPIVDMGRMKHEAVAVDSGRGYVYLTEDNGPSGFYRFRPNETQGRLGALERGGTLEMLSVRGRPNADLGSVDQGDAYDIEWVRIDEPDAAAERRGGPPDGPIAIGLGKSGPFLQGEALGGAEFRRLEGCFAHGGLIYFIDTTGGAAQMGTVWALTPTDDGPDSLRCVYASPGEHEADHIDNVCVSPRGGIVLCEDGGGAGLLSLERGTRLVGLGLDSAPFPFADNNLIVDGRLERRPWIEPGDYRGMEFAGACFSPRGDRLFVNIQTPGVTFEIRGPWESGPL